MPFIPRQSTDRRYLNFVIVEIKHWNSPDFDIRTAVLLIVRVQRKRVLVDMNIDGLAETVDLADNTPTAVIYVISCYLYHTYCTRRVSVTFPPVYYTFIRMIHLFVCIFAVLACLYF